MRSAEALSTMSCPACGYENPPGMRFCGQCGTALAISASPGEERKLVTVLFADVVGSTRLAGVADPERVRRQMTRFFEISREEVDRYGGTVEKFIGDAVMAVFGLPAIHEDDPERAARAAASLRARVRSEVETEALPEIRVGINTGEVVADPRAAGKGEFLVTGEAVNLAARLQQHAEPGQILVGERAMRALRDFAHMRSVPPLTVKGLAATLPAWELVEIAPTHERQVRTTPFVGRAEELDLLHSYIRRMQREGRGHVISILGLAGIGKTRLVQEFRAQTDGAHSLRGRALPYGTGVPFSALGEAIREECGILLGDPLEVARQKLRDAVERLQVADAAHGLLAVLGLGGDGRDLSREALFSSMQMFFQALARPTSLVLILEDVHSAEDVTLDFIEHTAGWLRAVPVLLLVLARPELLERRPTWMGGKRNATTLFLEPLPGAQSHELLQGILGRKPAPPPLLEVVLDRAEGNPLFLEEMLRALLEQGVLAEHVDHWALTIPMTKVAVPDSVHAVIAARVDALPVAEKRVLQTAAVVGKDFWLGAVCFITDENHVEEALRALVGKDVLVLKQRSTLQGEEEYTFRHILIRDIAYAMFPKSQRWTMHARCAEWLHQIGGNRQAEYADFIAHHWLQVVALRRDLGLPPDARAREQAIANLLMAGDRAAGVYANTTALDHYTRALGLDPQSLARVQALLGRGQVWMLLGEYGQAREEFVAVRRLSMEARERRWEAVALDHLGHSYRQQDQIAHALEHLEPALALSREVGDPSLTGHILNHIGFTYFNIRRHAEAIRSHQEARHLLEGCVDLAGLAQSLHGLGENAAFLGGFREGIQWFSESVKVSDQIGHRSLSGENRYMLAHSWHLLGQYPEAQVEAERSMAALGEIGDVWNLAFALAVAAQINTTLGQFGKALEFATRGLGLARQIGARRSAMRNLWALSDIYREMENYHDGWQAAHEAAELGRTGEVHFRMPNVLSSLALNVAARGRTDEAQAHIEEAHRSLRAGQSGADEAHDVAHANARVLLALGRPAEAVQAAKVLLEEVAASGILYYRAQAMLLLGDAMLAFGDQAGAVPVYEAVVEEAQNLGRTPLLWQALAGLGEAQRAMGQTEKSAASARRARETVERLAATVPDERLRATFLQSRKVQRVAALASDL